MPRNKKVLTNSQGKKITETVPDEADINCLKYKEL